jgi:hypothetical protein
VEKYGGAGQATDGSMAHAHCMLGATDGSMAHAHCMLGATDGSMAHAHCMLGATGGSMAHAHCMQGAIDDSMAHAHLHAGCHRPQNTLREFVIIIAFPVQQWLHEHASIIHTLSVLFIFILCAFGDIFY